MALRLRDRSDHYLPQGYLRGFVSPDRETLASPLWCFYPNSRQWRTKSTAQVGYLKGLYDFANETIDAEHADITFRELENTYPRLLAEAAKENFERWAEHEHFFLRYMQMMRARSPLFFDQQREQLQFARIVRVTDVDESANRIGVDSLEGRSLTTAESKDHSLSMMREEIKRGADWASNFHWTLRYTNDASDPVITGEQPLFFRGAAQSMEIALASIETQIFFPLCWRACLVGNLLPFPEKTKPFAADKLRAYRSMVVRHATRHVISPQKVWF